MTDALAPEERAWLATQFNKNYQDTPIYNEISTGSNPDKVENVEKLIYQDDSDPDYTLTETADSISNELLDIDWDKEFSNNEDTGGRGMNDDS